VIPDNKTNAVILSIFTRFTGGALADAVQDGVVLPALGAHVGVVAELTVGNTRQAGAVGPVGVEAPRTVDSAIALVEEALLSALVCHKVRSHRIMNR